MSLWRGGGVALLDDVMVLALNVAHVELTSCLRMMDTCLGRPSSCDGESTLFMRRCDLDEDA
jgi:hypothetical protein